MTAFNELDPERKAKMDALLDQPILARIASASARTNQPHIVPVWFLWDGESVWISSYVSTRKVRELQGNPRCAILIDDPDSQLGIAAALLEGQAELVAEPRDFMEEMTARVYTRYLGPEGVLAPDPQSWIHSPEALLIKLTPQDVYIW